MWCDWVFVLDAVLTSSFSPISYYVVDPFNIICDAVSFNAICVLFGGLVIEDGCNICAN